jgi:hypothetical protein
MDETDACDGHWWTYAQLAQARQIGKRAAVRLAQRHRLRRQPGNDGQTRVWVPTDMASSSPHRPTPPASDADDTSPDVAPPFHAQALSALEAALADAGRRADEAGKRADDALALADSTMARLADAESRAGKAEAALAGERVRAEVMRSRLDEFEATATAAVTRAEQAEARANQARAEAEEALQGAERLRQAEEARKARGRLRRAWDGWRGR